VKHTKAEAKHDIVEVKEISTGVVKKATDDVVLKICEQIYDKVMQATQEID
jgi:hypothetical protein